MKTVARTGKFKKNFDSMTPSERRVAIAKDVLSQLRIGSISARSGSYVLGISGGIGPLHEVIDGAIGCEVCALGAMCLSAARKFDGIEVNFRDELQHERAKILKILSPYFTVRELASIECAFEGQAAPEEAVIQAGRLDNRSMDFAYLKNGVKLDVEFRMRKIMRNIVRNKGQFILPKVKP